MILQAADGVASIGYLSQEQPFEGRRAQAKRHKMLNILTLLHEGGALYTNDISLRLGLTASNCNYLLAELERQGLIHRDKETHPSGGPVYLNRAVPAGLFPNRHSTVQGPADSRPLLSFLFPQILKESRT
ncbi:MAG: winged helix-turn-helix transcriptional regulator [bacterium]|nr:winged helix-turn-helix transcriptional regulator [bacterium]